MIDGLPQQWRFESDDEPTIANVDWWKSLNDPILDELILEALDNNKDLKIAIARVFEFWAIYGQVRSFLLPEVDGTSSFTRQQVSLFNVDPPLPSNFPRIYNIYNVAFSFVYELDVWGRIRSLSEAALSDYLAEIGARRTVILTLVSSVASAYVTLLQYDLQMQISQDTLKSRRESYELAVLRFEGGLTSELEVEQAASEVEDALTRVKQLEILIPQQENLISVLIGHNPESIKRGVVLDKLNLPPQVPAGLPSDILEQRPDVVQAEQQLLSANALIGAARALFFPTISLTGLYGNSSVHLSDLLTSGATQWNIVASAFLPIFNAGRTGYQVDAADMRKLQALYNYQKTVQTAFQEVDDALIAHQKSKELVAVQTRRVEVLKRYLNLATLQYENGQTDYLNVLDAERNLFSAQLDLAQAKSNSFLTFIALYKALGGGWVVAADRECIVKP